jgi:hypothetical protein
VHARRLDGLPIASGSTIQLRHDWARVAGSAAGYDTAAPNLLRELLPSLPTARSRSALLPRRGWRLNRRRGPDRKLRPSRLHADGRA